MEERKKKRKNHLWWNLILLLAMGVFLYSGFQLYTIFSEYAEGEGEYRKLQEAVVTMEKPEESEEDDSTISETKEFLRIDFEALRQVNPDVVGWISFEEPSIINYPIVQGKDNDTYLTKTFEGKYNKLGALFVDCRNQGDFSGINTFIYGHNMKNGSMFGRLRKYRDQEFYQKYPYFYIYTVNGKVSTYQIFSVSVVDANSDSYQMEYLTEEAYQNYIDYIKRQSLYETGVEVTTASPIVSLSTCTNVSEDERLLVHGVKIAEEEIP